MSAVFPSITKFCLLGLLFGLCSTVGYALDSQVFSDPAEHVLDGRLQAVRKIETFYSFPRYTDLAAWEARKAELRTHLWVSMGAYPEPPKTPLNAKIYDKMEFSDFAVEKAFFESLPGFYATGTLYRPKGKTGPFPAVLCPHGHWKEGRLTHSDENSIPTRCMNFAKQGFVVFAIDMVGYNDSLQIDHKFGGPAEWLWGLSLPGLQFWNSIRAVDFLASLPEVDPNRIGCTGASGGGTQTFNLMAADERVRFAAPVNMLSAHYQGGCLCENCPNSRIGAFNVEFGAMMAPRPLMMIACTGDWTNETPWMEFPAIQSIYKLYGAEDAVRFMQQDTGHNYNQLSREAVYAAFGEWVLGDANAANFKEKPLEFADIESLRIFPDGLPEGTKTKDAIVAEWKRMSEEQWASRQPTTSARLWSLQATAGTALGHVLSVHLPDPNSLVIHRVATVKQDPFVEKVVIGRRGQGDQIPGILYLPARRDAALSGTVLVHGEGRAAFFEQANGAPKALLKSLLEAGQAVLIPDLFMTGEAKADSSARQLTGSNHFFTYNQTDTALRIQDILTAIAYMQTRFDVQRINLAACGEAGPWALLAASQAEGLNSLALDANGFDSTSDEAFLHQAFVPGLRRAGDFRTAQALLAPVPLLIHNTQDRFDTSWAEMSYKTFLSEERLQVHAAKAEPGVILRWLTR